MGQTLRVPLLESRAEKHKGKWKDGIFSCFRLGMCHPTVCNALVCPQILLGQILTRMKMSWLAIPSVGRSPSVVRKCFALIVLVSVHDILVAPPPIELSADDASAVFLRQNRLQMLYQATYLLMSFISTIYGVLVMVKLRAAVRMKYGIPTGRLGRLEDLVYVFCCNCCVMSQLARQTADYNTHPSMCCSPTGTAQPQADDTDEEEGLLPDTGSIGPVAIRRATYTPYSLNPFLQEPGNPQKP